MNLENIKEKIDIVDVVGKYVKLRQVGKYYVGLCPFHKETKPSFYVSSQLQIFKCFGCGESGDIFKFLMKIDNLNFSQVLEKLKEEYGIEIEPRNGARISKRILEINYAALKFFRQQLKNKKDVLDYLNYRGLNSQTIEKFEIGFSPGNVLLRDYLYSLGYDYETIKKAGLIDNKDFDRFQSRIIFPLRDDNGRLVGFTGRIFPENSQAPKYLNSPETELFKKSHFLYGLYYAKEYIIQEKRVILVEGQFDFLLSWQNNYRSLVATSGSALTPYHLSRLKKYTSKIVFAFDNDPAGLEASLRANLIAQKLGFTTFQLKYPTKDLAEFFNSGSAKIEIEEEKFEDYLLDYLLKKYGLQNKYKILETFLPQIKNLKPLETEKYLERLSTAIDINKETLIKEIQNLPSVDLVNETEGVDKKNQLLIVEERSLEEKFSLRLVSLLYLSHRENYQPETDLNEIKKILADKFNHLLEKMMNNDLSSEELEYLDMTRDFYLTTKLNFQKEIEKTLLTLKTLYLKNSLQRLNEKLKVSSAEESDKIIESIQNIVKELKLLVKNEKKV
ncbi:MAG: DNA primase [Patescibacteria group bacterium]|nr:DNA primase [Patescibacteria group bacterium]